MAKRGFTKQLELRAEELGIEASENSIPILLRQVARRRRVTEVVFCPLLVDALLTTHGSGFRVFFCSDRAEAATLLKAYESESAAALLPTRVRFSLAHELAHTLLYDLTEPRPRPAKFAANNDLDDLERLCNRLAGHLLVPSECLKAEVGRFPALMAKVIIGSSARFGVSPEVLVARLDSEPALLMLHDLHGCIVVLARTSQGHLVKVIARPRNINIPAELKVVRRGELWQIGGSALTDLLAKEEVGQMVLPLTLETPRAREQKDCVFEFMHYGTSPDGELYLATVNVAGSA